MTRQIPDSIITRQHEASNPEVSAWVRANAGSGKTHVLAQRVIRLLLRGVDPATILCITFTKAAAANMAMRVFNTLAGWTALDDEALDAAIRSAGETPNAGTRAAARRLFARALETPGGLKVQTIHAFCTRLLHQFPFEANVAARFSVLDDATQSQILDDLVLEVLLEGAAKPESALGRALAFSFTAAADQTFREVITEAIGKRERIGAWIDRAGGVDAAIAEITGALGLHSHDTSETIEAEFFGKSPITAKEWTAIVDALSQGSSTDKGHAARITSLATLSGTARVDKYLEIFCTGKLEPRDNVMTVSSARKYPELAQRLETEKDRVCALLERRKAVACRDRTAALLTVAAEVIKRYRAEKDRRGLLDYNDLIEKTRALLREDAAAAWVHFKLDLGINHVLIDEAQDIGPAQWEIVTKLVSEFTAGAGARGATTRTLFAVGDEKQAIFSFQGSVPREFADKGRFFEKAHKDAALAFESVVLSHSFRSGEVVLQSVDAVFTDRAISASVTTDTDGIPPHIALPDAAPGEVEIWELLGDDAKGADDPWNAPFDAVDEAGPRVLLARKIAKHVARLLKERPILGTARRPLTPGGILILVRQRGPLFEAIIRALKNEDIPVAGADRLILTEHIAIMDLIALADAILLPQDDLALASVLKSPLFGFDDDDLYDLAKDRGHRSLWDTLRARADAKPRFGEASALVRRLAKVARTESPFTFFTRLLGPEGGRRRFLARLGLEANDALDEFLNLALTYESRETPSLQGFVAWLRAAQADVKRDMEIARDEVRVMTAHGAKGLEAPLVILADTTTRPKGYHPARLLALPAKDEAPGAPERFLWVGAQPSNTEIMQAARDADDKAAVDEYRRLLYVAMTRAEERLIICGAAGKLKKDGTLMRPEGCWYDLVFEGMKDRAIETQTESGEKVWRYFKSSEAIESATIDSTTPATAPAIPEWLGTAAPKDAPALLVITPSDSGEDDIMPGGAPPGLGREKARARGVIVHRLLQSLPDIPAEQRAEAARRYLTRATSGMDFSDAEIAAIAEGVLRILSDPHFAPLFAPGSRAEVPIVGRIEHAGETIGVSGQMDRLAVTADEILIADYKTGNPAPRSPEESPKAYLRQLALYRALLMKIYPGRAVRAALLWTDRPDLMEIPAALLDARIANLTPA